MNAHVLGFPRMGLNRELKWALEKYWRGEIPETDLVSVADELKQRHWDLQAAAGMDLLPVGDFSLYDHVLDTIAMLGTVPERFAWDGKEISHKTYFHMARGDAEKSIPAMEMTKWFDSNYHYIVPELSPDTPFKEKRLPPAGRCTGSQGARSHTEARSGRSPHLPAAGKGNRRMQPLGSP